MVEVAVCWKPGEKTCRRCHARSQSRDFCFWTAVCGRRYFSVALCLVGLIACGKSIHCIAFFCKMQATRCTAVFNSFTSVRSSSRPARFDASANEGPGVRGNEGNGCGHGLQIRHNQVPVWSFKTHLCHVH